MLNLYEVGNNHVFKQIDAYVHFDCLGMTKLTVTSFTQQQLPFCSVNHFLYSLIRSSRVYRRTLICQLLKIFDDDTSMNVEEQLFVADNLAYFPYQVQDEPLYIVEQIDLIVSVNGSTQLQQCRDLLKQQFDYVDDDDNIDRNQLEDKFLRASKVDVDLFQQCLDLTKSTMLLLLLKSYLKDIYGLNETKIIEYDHTECSKLLDRPIVHRKLTIEFEPKIILDTIKSHSNWTRNEQQRRQQMISEFLEFKRHLLAFDMDIDETLQSINELLPTSATSSKVKKKTSGNNKRRKVIIDSDDESIDTDF
jgi:cohesin loading factor subunit SCC2